METITITLDRKSKDFIDQVVVEGKYSSPSDYLAALIAEERDRRRQARIDDLIDEALSEPAIPATDELWADIRKRFDERHSVESAK